MSADNVVTLAARRDDGPSADIIAELEWLLELARAGDIQGFAYVGVDGEGFVRTGWAKRSSLAAGLVVGGIAQLQWRACERWADAAPDGA